MPTTKKQLELLPTQDVEPTKVMIPTNSLPSSFSGTKPTAAFVKSIKAVGRIICPVILVDVTPAGQKNREYFVADGKRRILAAHKLGFPRIAAEVYLADWIDLDVLLLTCNTQRAPNTYVEFMAITNLLNRGMTVDRIINATKLSKDKVNKVAGMATALDSILYSALIDTTISLTVATRASKLTKESQRGLARVFAEKGKLTCADVKRFKDAEKAEAEQLELMPGNRQFTLQESIVLEKIKALEIEEDRDFAWDFIHNDLGIELQPLS